MFNDIVELRDFYAGTLGQVAKRLVRRQLRQIWPSLHGQRLLGVGYAAPFLRPYLDDARVIGCVMPAAQGVAHWPREGPGRALLADETHLPFETESIDRAIIVHAVECTRGLNQMMRELWRVLRGEGRVILIVPNRTSVWAQVDRTPFGHGHPYSRGQVNRLLRDSLFVPERYAGALWIPPTRSRFLLRGAGAWEEIGSRWLPGLAGLTLVEASKQLYALPRGGAAETVRRPMLVPLQGRAAGAARGSASPQEEDQLLGEQIGPGRR